MAFTTDLANLVAAQLERFVTLNPHQLAGQVENLDFWIGQVRNALEAIDGYGVRFVRMEAAQERNAPGRPMTDYNPASGMPQRAAAPRRVPDQEMRKARRTLTDAVTRFLDRCAREHLLSESRRSEVLRQLGISSDEER